MKTTYRHFAAAIALVAAVSCAKQEETNPQGDNTTAGTYEFILNVAQEDITKTTMDGLNILWSKDDQIGIMCFGDNSFQNPLASGGPQSINDKENYTPSTSASFKISLTEGFEPKVAAYPYNDKSIYTNGNSTDNVDACSVEIPAEQTGIKGNIPANTLAMVGKIDKTDGSCSMSNVGAVIKFEITGDNITSLRFEGNNSEYISGTRFYFAGSGNGHVPGEILSSKDEQVKPQSYVKLVPEGDVFEPGDYYFVVSQNTLTDGFKMTLTNSLGVQAVRKSTTEFKIERNHKYTNFGSDEGWFNDVRTGVAGNLGTLAGTTATLYGIAPDTIEGDYVLGFQISTNNSSWSEFEGKITERFSTTHDANVFTGQIEGLTPETTYYFRATYTGAAGATTYGKTKTFKTYANAYSAVIDMCTGVDDWPFTNIAHGTGGLVSGTSGVAISKGEDLTLTTSTAESFVVKAEGGVWINTQKGCLTMGVNRGEYIKFPVIEGKKPVCVTLLAGNMGDSSNPQSTNNCLGYPSIGKVSAVNEEETFTVTEVAGGQQWDPVPMSIYDSHAWYLSVTDSGKYGIYFNHNGKRNCYISLLEVVYIDASQTTTVTDNLVWWEGHGNHSDSSNPDVATYPDPVWPFVEGRSSWDSNYDYEFSSKANENFKYSFKSNNKVDYSRAGLKIGGLVGNYIAIKPSGGYRLKSVRMRGGNSSNSYSIVDVQDNVITGGETKDIASAYDSELTFTLSDTTADTEYRLRINTATITQIREMWIEYELVN